MVDGTKRMNTLPDSTQQKRNQDNNVTPGGKPSQQWNQSNTRNGEFTLQMKDCDSAMDSGTLAQEPARTVVLGGLALNQMDSNGFS